MRKMYLCCIIYKHLIQNLCMLQLLFKIIMTHHISRMIKKNNYFMANYNIIKLIPMKLFKFQNFTNTNMNMGS